MPVYKRYKFYINSLFHKCNIYICFVQSKVTHVAETICFLASQIVHHTLAGIKAGTAIVKRSTRAQVPKTYFIYYTFQGQIRDIKDWIILLKFIIILISVFIWIITGMTTAYSLEQSSSVGLRSLVGFFIRRRKILRRGQWWWCRNLQSSGTLPSTLISFWPKMFTRLEINFVLYAYI